MNVKEIRLSDLQKLALNYFLATGFLNYVLINSNQIQAMIVSMKHFELIESILGKEIIEAIKTNPKDREYLFEQASVFSRTMTNKEDRIEDFFESDEDDDD
jgi:hypothetical protein